MKKFTKIMLIIAAVCAVVGIVLCTVGAALGGTFRGKGWSSLWWFGDNTFDTYDDYGISDDIDVDDIEEFEDLEKELDKALDDVDPDAEDLTTIYTVSAQKLRGLSELDLEINGGVLLIQTGDYEELTVSVNERYEKRAKINVDEEELSLVVTRKKSWGEYPVVVMHVPKKQTFSDISVEINAGKMTAPVLMAQEISLYVSASKMEIARIEASQADLETDAGALVVGSLQAREADIETNAGAVKILSGSVQDGDFSCNAGAQSIYLTGDPDACSYDIQTAVGHISVNGDDYTGIASKYIKGSGGASYSLECNVGNIDLWVQEDERTEAPDASIKEQKDQTETPDAFTKETDDLTEAPDTSTKEP